MNTSESNDEPDWSNSNTLPLELWKNPLHSKNDRLLMADGAVHFYRQVIENLRSQLKGKNHD